MKNRQVRGTMSRLERTGLECDRRHKRGSLGESCPGGPGRETRRCSSACGCGRKLPTAELMTIRYGANTEPLSQPCLHLCSEETGQKRGEERPPPPARQGDQAQQGRLSANASRSSAARRSATHLRYRQRPGGGFLDAHLPKGNSDT